MRPVLFTWRGHAVPSYAAMLYVGVVLGLVAGNVAANASGLDGGRVYVASVLLLLPALAGARLASLAGDRDAWRAAGGGLWRRWQGGQAMYGGLVMVPASVPLLAVLEVPFGKFWDVGTFTVLVGMVFARAGCLLTGCCAGRPTEHRLGMVLPDRRGVRARRVPTQLLEGAVAVALLGGAVLLTAADLAPGSVFAATLAAYSVARLFLQPLRERQSRVAGVPALRVVSAAVLVLALVALPALR